MKKAEPRRIDTFKLWFWRRLERPLVSKEIKPVNPKGNQPWIFTGKTDAEAPILWPPDSLEKTLMLRKIAGKRRRGWQGIRWLDSIADSVDMNLSKLQETDSEGWKPGMLQSMGLQSHTQLSNWATMYSTFLFCGLSFCMLFLLLGIFWLSLTLQEAILPALPSMWPPALTPFTGHSAAPCLLSLSAFTLFGLFEDESTFLSWCISFFFFGHTTKLVGS